jgi:purine-binding chemotaxis protein CheW
MKMNKKDTTNSFLTFRLEEELYAVHVGKVLNILEMVRITKVPQAPPYMKGVINLRGKVLPIIDLRSKFNMPQVVNTSSTCMIVMDIEIENRNLQLGSIVDSVQEVLEVDANLILEPPNIGAKFKSDFIYGMINKQDQFIMLLDMDKLFSEDDIISLETSSNNVHIDLVKE